MRTKIRHNLGKIVLVLLIIATILSAVLLNLSDFAKAKVGYAEKLASENSAVTQQATLEVLSDCGNVRKQYTQNEANAAQSPNNRSWTWVTSEEELRTAIKNNADIMLGSNIDFNVSASNSSGNFMQTAFTGILDGNGFTVNINATETFGIKSTPVSSSDLTKTKDGRQYGVYSYFIPVNHGTIKNTKFVYTSNHSMDGQGADLTNAQKHLESNNNNQQGAAAGIITGINNGTITNVALDIQGQFAFGHAPSQDNNSSDLRIATVFAGGMAGIALENNVIENSSVNIAANTNGTVIAKHTHSFAEDKGRVFSGAGGYVGSIGNFSQTNTRFTNNILTGNGDVIAHTVKTPYRSHMYSGGYIAGAIAFSSGTDFATIDMTPLSSSYAISGLISTWTGRAISRGMEPKSEAVIRTGGLFNYIGRTADNIIFGYKTSAYSGQWGGYIDSENEAGKNHNGVTNDKDTHINYYGEVYAETGYGKIQLGYEKDSNNTTDREYTYNGYAKICAVADDADRNVSYINEQLTAGNKLFDLPNIPSQFAIDSNINKARIIFSAITTNNEASTHSAHAGHFLGVYMENWKLNTLKSSLEISFGEMLDYEIVNDNGTLISMGKKTYDGEIISSSPKVRFSSDYNTAVDNLTAKSWAITRTPIAIGSETPQPITVTPGYDTSLTGDYLYYPRESVSIVQPDMQSFAYYNAERKLVSRLNTENNYLYIVEPASTIATLQETDWAKTATFEIKAVVKNQQSNQITKTLNFDAYRVYRENSEHHYAALGYSATAASYVDTESTGTHGAPYTFSAYRVEGDETVLIAKAERNVAYTAKIDNGNPVFSSIKVYSYVEDINANYKGNLLEDHNGWYNQKVTVEFLFDDEYRSGIASVSEIAGSSYTQTHNIMDDNEIVGVVYVLDRTSTLNVRITDKVGNFTDSDEKVFNIDTVNISISGFQIFSDYKEYEVQDFRITLENSTGASGWKVYYQVVTHGEDIKNEWVLNEDLTTNINKGSRTLIYSINYNMNNQGLYFKFVNDQGIFEDYITGFIGPYGENSSSGWTLNLKFGTLQYETSNIFYNGTAISEWDPDELKKVLTKQFDGTNKVLVLDGFSFTDPGQVMIDLAQGIEISNIDRDLLAMGNFEIIASYDGINVSDGGTITLELRGKTQNNINEMFSVTIDGYDRIQLDSEITRREINYNLENDSCTVEYGTKVPTSKTIKEMIGNVEVEFLLKFETDANIDGANIGNYLYTVNTDDYDNFIINVSGEAQVTVVAKKVMITTELDGETNHSASISYDTSEHTLKAYYYDLKGDKIECKQKITEPTSVSVIKDVADYIVEFTIDNPNYAISESSLDTVSFKITKATMQIGTGTQRVQYDKGAQVFKPVIPAYAKGKLTLTYYSASNVVYNDDGTVSKADLGQIIDQSHVVNTGVYKVNVQYTLDQSEVNNFNECENKDGWLIIEKAPLKFVVNNQTEIYTGGDFGMSFTSGTGAMQIKHIQLFVTLKNGTTMPYDEYTGGNSTSDIAVEAWVASTGKWETGIKYNQTGEYEYRLTYAGNDNYTEATGVVKLIIINADFKGIEFSGQTFDFEEGKARSISAQIPSEYKDARVTYRATGTIGSSDKPIEKINAGEYTVTVTVSLKNYNDYVREVKMTINKAKLKDIYAESKEVEYDGNAHKVELKGIDKYTARGINLIVTPLGDTEATRAGIYVGSYRVTSNNYESMTIETSLTINPKAVVVDYQGIIDANIDSAKDISDLQVTYIDPFTGEAKPARIAIYDAEGKEVDTSVTKKLSAGEYTARIVMDNGDYVASTDTAYVTFVVEPASNLLPIIVVGGAAVIVIGLVVVIIVVAMKKKGGKRKV